MSSSDGSQSASTDDGTIEQERVVSLRSSCAWKEVVTGSTCALKPRTCRECLNTTPSNGNGCTLTPTGLCKNMEAYVATQDYRRTTSTGTEANYFLASNASYCDASDAACTNCMHNATQVAHLSDFCTGKDGCVCVAICETAQWETLAEVQLPYTMNLEQETSTCKSSVSTTADASATSSWTSSASTAAPTVKKNVFANEDPCTWYTNQTRCGLPRTCYDCLNVPLNNGDKCTITPSGYCASMHRYDPSLDFRLNASTDAQHYFPSANTSYCNANDSVCSQCRATTFKASSDGSMNPSQYCVGENGCVCVAFCESSVWKPIVVDALCDTNSSSSSASTNSLSMAVPMRAIALIVVVAIAVPSLITVLFSCRARSQRRQSLARAEQRRCEGRGPSLELQAWKAMREELIENEHHLAPEEQRRRERRMSLPMSLRNSEALSSVVRSSMDAERVVDEV